MLNIDEMFLNLCMNKFSVAILLCTLFHTNKKPFSDCLFNISKERYGQGITRLHLMLQCYQFNLKTDDLSSWFKCFLIFFLSFVSIQQEQKNNPRL